MMTITRILVPHDLETTSDAALAYACELARTFGAELLLLHVMENPFMRAVPGDPRDIEAGTKQQLAGRIPPDDFRRLQVRVALEESDHPVDAILDRARNEQIDLVVMGTHGRGGMERVFIGSVAERVIRRAPCPVLTVRARPQAHVA